MGGTPDMALKILRCTGELPPWHHFLAPRPQLSPEPLGLSLAASRSNTRGLLNISDTIKGLGWGGHQLLLHFSALTSFFEANWIRLYCSPPCIAALCLPKNPGRPVLNTDPPQALNTNDVLTAGAIQYLSLPGIFFFGHVHNRSDTAPVKSWSFNLLKPSLLVCLLFALLRRIRGAARTWKPGPETTRKWIFKKLSGTFNSCAWRSNQVLTRAGVHLRARFGWLSY